jgi:hypothetical protein
VKNMQIITWLGVGEFGDYLESLMGMSFKSIKKAQSIE